MATTKVILKKTHQEAIVKVAGTGATETISLTTDLLPTTQVLGATGAQAANIAGVTWTGANDGIITISRGGVGASGATGVVMTLQANACGQLDFSGQAMIPDPIGNTSNIEVAISGAQAECWLKLRKVSGYVTTVEPEQFGSHDNPSVAGS
jgi:hypothetical protein